MRGSNISTELTNPLNKLKMTKHNLSDRTKYPKFHKWVSVPKINVYSTEAINTGDKIELKGETFTVTKASSSKPNEEYAAGKTMFYEIEIVK